MFLRSQVEKRRPSSREGCDEAAGIKRAKRVRGPGLEDKAKQSLPKSASRPDIAPVPFKDAAKNHLMSVRICQAAASVSTVGVGKASKCLARHGVQVVKLQTPAHESAADAGVRFYHYPPEGATEDDPEVRLLSELHHVPNGAVDEETGATVFVKLDRKKATVLVGQRYALSKALAVLDLHMPQLDRGKGCESSSMCAVGVKKAYHVKVEPYATQKDLPEGAKEKVESALVVVRKWICTVERAFAGFIPKGRRDEFRAAVATLKSDDERLSPYSCAFASAVRFLTKIHTDRDVYFSICGVLDAEPVEGSVRKSDALVQHFTFPDYGIYTRMLSGDVIMFNSMLAHGASEPEPGIVTPRIFSAYMNHKTVVCE